MTALMTLLAVYLGHPHISLGMETITEAPNATTPPR
jgi:hypothetical protein